MVKSTNHLKITYKPFSPSIKPIKTNKKFGNIKISLDNVLTAQSYTDILCSNRKKVIDGEQMYVFTKKDLNNLKSIWCLKFLQEIDENKYENIKKKLSNESNDISSLVDKFDQLRLN